MACKLCSPNMPDYTQAAQAQGAANRETAIAQSNLNNPNMHTPYGSQVYTDPEVAGGRPTLTQTLDPAEQAKLDAERRVQLQSMGILEEDMPNIKNALLGPFGLAGSSLQGGYDPRYEPTDTVQTRANLSSAGPIQSGLDFSGAPGMPQADAGVRDLVSKSIYDQGARFLDPQFAQAQGQLDSTLANQGIVRNPSADEGNSAWQAEQNNLARQKAMTYGDLRDRAVKGGGDAMEQLFGMQMGARQQGVGETSAQGQFRNAAQQQAVQQILDAIGVRNTGVATQAQIAANQAGLQGNQRQQAYQEYAGNRTMPLNMLNALLSQSQINNPTFQPTAPTSITPPPILQRAQLQGQANAAQTSAMQNLLGQGLGFGAKFIGG